MYENGGQFKQFFWFISYSTYNILNQTNVQISILNAMIPTPLLYYDK